MSKIISKKVLEITIPVFWYAGRDEGYVLDTRSMEWCFQEEIRKLAILQADGVRLELSPKNRTDEEFNPMQFQQWWGEQ